MWIARPHDESLRRLLDTGATRIVVHGLAGSGASESVRRALEGRDAKRVELVSLRAHREPSRRSILWVDQVHDASAARRVERMARAYEGVLVVASRRPISIAGAHRVATTSLTDEETRTWLAHCCQQLRIPVDSTDLEALASLVDGWPLALQSVARAVRLLGVQGALQSFSSRLDAPLRGPCVDALRATWKSQSSLARATWASLSFAHAPLDATQAAAWLGDEKTRALEALLVEGILHPREGLLHLPRPLATFARLHAPRAMRDDALRAHTQLVLRDGEEARARFREEPVVAGERLRRLQPDLLALACQEDAQTSVRATLALEPLLVGHLDRDEVVSLFERARRNAKKLTVELRAKTALALARTWISRGDHESAASLLAHTAELQERPESKAYVAIYLGHIAAWRKELERAEALLDEVDVLVSEDVKEDARLQRIFIAMQRGDLDETDRLSRIAAEHAARRPSPRMFAAVRRFVAESMLLRGDARGAIPLLTESRDAFARYGDHAGALFFTSRLVYALREAGRSEEAEIEAQHASARAAHSGEPTLELTVLSALEGRTASWTRIAELAWRTQMPLLREQAERWLADHTPHAPPRTLHLDARTMTASLDDKTLSLARRKTLWRALQALAAAHQRASSLSQEALFVAAWPGEKAEPTSQKKRVQTAMWTLRKLLLGASLETKPEGYALTANVRAVLT